MRVPCPVLCPVTQVGAAGAVPHDTHPVLPSWAWAGAGPRNFPTWLGMGTGTGTGTGLLLQLSLKVLRVSLGPVGSIGNARSYSRAGLWRVLTQFWMVSPPENILAYDRVTHL